MWFGTVSVVDRIGARHGFAGARWRERWSQSLPCRLLLVPLRKEEPMADEEAHGGDAGKNQEETTCTAAADGTPLRPCGSVSPVARRGPGGRVWAARQSLPARGDGRPGGATATGPEVVAVERSPVALGRAGRPPLRRDRPSGRSRGPARGEGAPATGRSSAGIRSSSPLVAGLPGADERLAAPSARTASPKKALPNELMSCWRRGPAPDASRGTRSSGRAPRARAEVFAAGGLRALSGSSSQTPTRRIRSPCDASFAGEQGEGWIERASPATPWCGPSPRPLASFRPLLAAPPGSLAAPPLRWRTEQPGAWWTLGSPGRRSTCALRLYRIWIGRSSFPRGHSWPPHALRGSVVGVSSLRSTLAARVCFVLVLVVAVSLSLRRRSPRPARAAGTAPTSAMSA